MSLIIWNAELSIGLPSVDEQHKELVEMLNDLHEAVQSGAGKEVVDNGLVQLLAHTVRHFDYEEKLFEKTGYPATDEHKKEHVTLMGQALEIKRKFEESSAAALSMEIMNFLRNWLVEHIQDSDRKFVPYLIAHGVN